MSDLATRLQGRDDLDRVMSFGGLALAAATAVAYTRMEEGWAAFPLLLLAALPCAALFALALAPGLGEPAAVAAGVPAEGAPGRWQAVLLAAGHFLLLLSLLSLVRVLGVDEPGDATFTWTLTVTAASALYFAERLDSPGLRLLGLLLAGAALLALLSWVDNDAGATAFRNVLLLEAVGFALLARMLRPERPEHSHVAVAVAATALIAAATLGAFADFDFDLFAPGFSSAVEGPPGDRDGWELVLVAASLGALAYSGWQRYRGTVYPGLVGLVIFIGISADGSLWGWPLILLAAAAACFGWALYGNGDTARPGTAPPREPVPPPAPPRA